VDHILIVEDEGSIRKALAMGLASKDFEVDVVADGNGGILQGQQKEYDILIADLCLPDMDGLDVIKEVKHISPEIIPIIITGNGSMDSSLEAIRLEVSDYLEKPLRMESVKDAISRGLEKRAAKRKAMRKKLDEMLEMYKKLSGATDPEGKVQNGGPDQISEKQTAMLVHQINNPLMSISGSAELGMLRLDNATAVQQYFTRIIKAAEKITEINKEIMNLSHPVKEKVEEVDIRDILDNRLCMFKDLMSLKQISFEKDQGDLLLTVWGSRFGLDQLFGNLILNAIDSMDDTPEKQLKIWTEVNEEQQKIVVHIEDTGCGIPDGVIDHIFTPYFTNKKNGTGLGLSVVKSIVESYNGAIKVESEVGKGTTFTISLPIAE